LTLYKFNDMNKLMYIVVFTVLISVSGSMFGQSRELTAAEKIQARKVAYFTDRLSLSPGEAEKFWPIYNDFQAQRAKIQLEKQQLIRSFNQGEGSLNNSQLAEIGDRLIGTVVKESELAVSFHAKLKEVLPPAKVIRFYQAENQFRLLLLNELQNRQQNRERQEPADLPDL